MILARYLSVSKLRLLLNNATVPNPPPIKGINEGNVVGMGVTQPINNPFPIARPHSSLNPYLWSSTLGIVNAIATAIEITQLAPRVLPSVANYIQSIANIPNPTRG